MRGVLLAVALVLSLIMASIAVSLLRSWQLDPGGEVTGLWRALLGTREASARSDALALLAAAFFGGASLACLVFVLERLLKAVRHWTRSR